MYTTSKNVTNLTLTGVGTEEGTDLLERAVARADLPPHLTGDLKDLAATILRVRTHLVKRCNYLLL